MKPCSYRVMALLWNTVGGCQELFRVPIVQVDHALIRLQYILSALIGGKICQETNTTHETIGPALKFSTNNQLSTNHQLNMWNAEFCFAASGMRIVAATSGKICDSAAESPNRNPNTRVIPILGWYHSYAPIIYLKHPNTLGFPRILSLPDTVKTWCSYCHSYPAGL